ncbi:MAG: hypothetical protein ABI810_00590 [Sphingomonas bacterium]
MRTLLLATSCLCLAACSKAPDRETDSTAGSSPQTFDVADRKALSEEAASSNAPPAMVAPSAMVAPGGIGVTAAPGVAFSYHYGFRLPSASIAAAQEAHAQACEKLGVLHCRITGMRYRLLGENNVEAMLAFKLDPALARGFGKAGIGVVEAARGTLVDAEITGNDAGAEIDRLKIQHARAEDEQKRLDAELAKPKLSQEERAELQRQRAAAAQTISAANDSTAQQRESLADTPMVFDYGSGKAVRGFDASAPLTSAADTAIGSAQVTIAILLGLLAYCGPPGILLLLAWLAWRRFRPRRPAVAAAPIASEEVVGD